LDMTGDLIIAGSNRNKEVMQMYSLKQRDLIYNIEWDSSSRKDPDSGFLFATRFSKSSPNYIFGGGGGKNEVKVFENNADGSASFRPLAQISELDSPCLSIDTTKN
jgi:hypothetical protein